MYLASNPPGQGQLLNSAILTSVGQAQSNGTQRIVAVGGNDQSQTGRIPVKVEPIESGTDHDVKCDAHPSASFSSTSASELGTDSDYEPPQTGQSLQIAIKPEPISGNEDLYGICIWRFIALVRFLYLAPC